MSTSEEIDRLFAPIAAAVEAYAEQHGMDLRKCQRGISGWELVKAAPEGGDRHLLLLYEPSLGLGIGSVWYYRSDEMSRTYCHWRSMAACPIEAENVVAALESERAALATVRFGHWTHIQPFDPPQTRS